MQSEIPYTAVISCHIDNICTNSRKSIDSKMSLQTLLLLFTVVMSLLLV